MFRVKKAQSTLEYLIILTAIVGAILVAANGIIRTKVNSLLDHAATQAETAVSHINFE